MGDYTYKNQVKTEMHAACPQAQRTIFIQLQIPVTETKPFKATETQSPALVSKEFGAERH